MKQRKRGSPAPSCPHIDHIRSRYRRIRDALEGCREGEFAWGPTFAQIEAWMWECEAELERVRSINARLRAENRRLRAEAPPK